MKNKHDRIEHYFEYDSHIILKWLYSFYSWSFLSFKVHMRRLHFLFFFFFLNNKNNIKIEIHHYIYILHCFVFGLCK